jgi:hypothetical protein
VLGTLAASGFAFDDAFAQPLTPTPQCHDGDEPTIRQSEGPYFKPSSPLRGDVVEPNSKAGRVQLSGQVLTRPASRSRLWITSLANCPKKLVSISRRWVSADPYAKQILQEIERSYYRLVEVEKWMGDRQAHNRPFAHFGMLKDDRLPATWLAV